LADRRSKLVLGLFLVSAVGVLALSLYTGIALNTLVSSMENSRSDRLLAEAQAASLIVSADELGAITDVDSLSSESSAALKQRLSSFAALHHLAEVTYIRQMPSGELQYIISSSAGFGTFDVSTPLFEPYEAVKQAFGGAIVVSEVNDPLLEGTALVAYSPVFNTNGTIAAVATVIVNDESIAYTDSVIRYLTIILLVCISVVILAACANVLLQVRKEHELEENVQVQRLMSRLSQNLSSDQAIDDRIDETLETLGTYLGAFRTYIINTSDVDAATTIWQYWASKDSLNADKRLSEGDASVLCQMMRDTLDVNQDNKHAALCNPNVSISYNGRFAALRNTDTEAFIWAPLIKQNELWGVLVLDFSDAQKEFPEKDIQLVESAASDLIGAITRELYSEERERALDHAVHASEAKSEFLSNMSHEMRTPMNAIIGMTSIALGSTELSRKDYCLDHIRDASEHLLEIINDVLDMSSLQANELTLKYAPFSLRQAMESVINDYIFSLNEHNLNFSATMDEVIPSVLIGDRQRLKKILSNLLSNAIKFTPDGGSVAMRVLHLGVGPEGHRLRFEVEDTGIGVNPSMRDSLFSSFSQADSGANRKYGGTGLGLAISKHLVELMGGQIGLDSRNGVSRNVYSRNGDPQGGGAHGSGALNSSGSLFFFTVTLAADTETASGQTQLIPTDVLDTGLFGPEPGAPSRIDTGSIDQCSSGASGTSGAPDVPNAPYVPSTFYAPNVSNAINAPTTSGASVAPLAPAVQDATARGDTQYFEMQTELGGAASQVLVAPDLSDYRILLAEDIEINREVVLALLAESGIRIDVATNGLEALEAIKNDVRGYDLVFMDLQMPEMDGLDATRRIRALPDPRLAGIPIVAMTANVFQEDIDACFSAGMNDHIGKPLDLEEIYRILLEYLPEKVRV